MPTFQGHYQGAVYLARLTQFDREKSQELEKVLWDFHVYESTEEATKRVQILRQIDQVVKYWVKIVASLKGFQEEFARCANAKIFSFGSFGLSVYFSESNLDVLCVAPAYVSREEDFFGVLYRILETTVGLSELQPIESAHVPVMKFKLRGVQVDLIFANVNLSNIPQNLDISDESILANIDEQSVRSLNGARVSQRILRLVPNQQNFRKTLKILRVWAKRRGLYSSVTGLLGGINLAIMVAKVCQLYPNANLSMLVARFFTLYGRWHWPCAIMLCPITEGHFGLGLAQWNPLKNPRDASHHMPIITPVYPCMNSAYNVTPSALTFIMEQLQLGDKICEVIEGNTQGWSTLFAPYNFFANHEQYLQVDLVADNDADLKVWKSWARYRLRQFMLKIENVTRGMLQCHPHPTEYSDPKREYHCAYYIGLKRKKGIVMKEEPKFDITDTIKQFGNIVSGYGFKKSGMHISVENLTRKDIPEHVVSAQSSSLSMPSSSPRCMDSMPLEELCRDLSQLRMSITTCLVACINKKGSKEPPCLC